MVKMVVVLKTIFLFIIVSNGVASQDQSASTQYTDAKDIILNTCGQKEVQAAATSLMETGGTIYLPECTIEWTRGIAMPGGVSVIGKGTGSTTLSTSTNGAKFFVYEKGYGGKRVFSKVSNIKFVNTADSPGTAIVFRSLPFRMNNNEFSGGFGNPCISVSMDDKYLTGVIDHNKFLFTNGKYGITIKGHDTWVASSEEIINDPNAIYIEDNEIVYSGTTRDHPIVGHGGAHYVLRHNHFIGAGRVDAHGPCYGPKHGTRCVEIYNNVMDETWPQPDKALGIRAGCGVIYNNKFNNFRDGIYLTADSCAADEQKYPEYCQVKDMYIWDNDFKNVIRYHIKVTNNDRFIEEGSKYDTTIDGVRIGDDWDLIDVDRDYYLTEPADNAFNYIEDTYPHPWVTGNSAHTPNAPTGLTIMP